MQSIAEEGKRRGEIRSGVDCGELATLIASTLEGSQMSRLRKKEEPRDLVIRPLEEYLDTAVRTQKSKPGVNRQRDAIHARTPELTDSLLRLIRFFRRWFRGRRNGNGLPGRRAHPPKVQPSGRVRVVEFETRDLGRLIVSEI